MSEHEIYQFSRAHRTVWWPCVVSVPTDEGDTNAFHCRIKIKVPKKEDTKALLSRGAESMADHVLDWDVVDEDKKPIPFTRAAFLAAIEDGYFDAAVSKALLQAANGVRAKNS